jgi:hypothetical protein
MAKPKCQLLGKDGNVFSIIGCVVRALREAGFPDKAKEFGKRAAESKSYEEVLLLCHKYVKVT